MTGPVLAGAITTAEAGAVIVQTPPMDALMFFSASTPPYPVAYDLSNTHPPMINSDRDRAVLRALLTLALQRLDDQEGTAP